MSIIILKKAWFKREVNESLKNRVFGRTFSVKVQEDFNNTNSIPNKRKLTDKEEQEILQKLMESEDKLLLRNTVVNKVNLTWKDFCHDFYSSSIPFSKIENICMVNS